MEILAKLFGSVAKVKIIRLFLFNAGRGYDLHDIISRAKITPEAARPEIKELERAGLIRRRIFYKSTVDKHGEPTTDPKRKVSGWMLDERFPYLEAMNKFFTTIPPMQNRQILTRLAQTGKIKLIIISGFFIQNPNSRVDLLVVGDHFRNAAFESTIARIESDLGKEVKYVALETEEFNYRLGIYDKLIRDILDYPHVVVIDKIGIQRTPAPFLV
ncbi:MAG: Uncharacterized protein G01um101448_827 [Parcubacteria group bacterium Gr01-1014_48]|nr:MAG: Uncharacterized protein G01um101448_827 [Parcubacteria group bacterium Gr01-1014_48]TSD07776.1 MAG: Uncharacterized protein Greene07144_733 [Parcubacteria group bacterium Greene0714_4]